MKLDVKATVLTAAIVWGGLAMFLTGLGNLLWSGYGQGFLDAMASSFTGEYQLWVRHSDRRMVRQPGRMRERAGNPVRARRSRHGRMVARLERGHWPLTLANRPMRAP